MSVTYDTTGLRGSRIQTYGVAGLFRTCWNAFQEWRTRRALQGVLRGLSDQELMDIGTTRGEIDYVAANRSTDPRGNLSAQ
ncbi:hypothetical protein JQ596_34695 [Bradyrhizobium manausense]|uniref:DUF1127 domain-containing protein n=1 Tax=Bradyrhizobium TaxID=374 RepID=UPI001BAC460C|nr:MULTISPECIES: DUF1127 domain-containing protein [Bradyrhizobium]MBR0830668.1 hypothetical protein [Bradyrhizobium manausense]UVO31048.1 hypothetical protein KUF59_10580 [Bradyrhizobium arachidis]